jgi:hypothetical protein
MVRDIHQWPNRMAAAVAMLPPKEDMVARERFSAGVEWEVVRKMLTACNELTLTAYSGAFQQKLGWQQFSNTTSQSPPSWKKPYS